MNTGAKSVAFGLRVHSSNKSRAVKHFSERLAPPAVELLLKEVLQRKLSSWSNIL